MREKWKYIYGFVILAVLLGGIGLAKHFDSWQVSGRVNSDGSNIEITGTDIGEIKGWMTLDEVIEGYHLDKNDIYKTFHLSKDILSSMALKDIAAQTDETLSPAIIRDYIEQKQKP